MRITKLAQQYLAGMRLDEHLFLVDGKIITADGEAVKHAPRLISQTAYLELFRAFGRRGMPFFDMYYQLYLFSKTGERPPEGFVEGYRGASRILYQRLTSESVKNTFFTLSKDLRVLLTRLENGHANVMTLRRIAEAYGRLVVAVASDRDVFLRGRILDTREKWQFFRRMTGKEQRFERLRRDDAELYESIKNHRKVVQQLDREIEKTVLDQGLVPSRKQIRGKLVMTGRDPKSGDLYVFTPDGDVHGIDDFIEHLEKDRKARRRLERVFPEDLDQLRRVSDSEISDFAEGPVEYVAITDDKAKVDNLTRVYPVQEIGGEKVVVDGRFKGFYVTDLVHSTGRMIEGTAYNYDPKLGRPSKIETKNPDGSVNLSVTREPYCTLDSDGSLYLALPRGRAYTEIRRAMAKLAKLVPSISYEEGSYKARYRFQPKDFAAVREALGGLALSKAAMETIRDYFSELAKHELATSRENLGNYSADAIGGFRPGRDLFVKQRQCLAWIESRGWNGVGALDTGVGKCVTGDTLVSTNRGLVPIRDMGPEVGVPDSFTPVEGWSVNVGGRNLPVKSFYYSGIKPTVKITTRNGYELEGSFKHPVTIRDTDGFEKFVPLPNLMVGDVICIDRTSHRFPKAPMLPKPEKNQLHFNTRHYTLPERMTPDLAWLLGIIVAEAHVKNHITVQITQHRACNEIVHDDIRATLANIFGWANDAAASDRDKEIRVNSAHIRAFLEKLGVGPHTSHDKVVPHIIRHSDQESVKAFLAGLFDGEGSVNGNLEFSSSSEQLAKEVHLLLLALGIVSTRSPKQVSGYEHTYWRICITGDDLRTFESLIGFREPRKKERLRKLAEKRSNPNRDVIPHACGLVEGLRKEIASHAAGANRGGGMVTRWGSAFYNTLQHIRHGRRNPTYRFMRKLLEVAAEVGASETAAYRDVLQLVERHHFYDPIVKIEVGTAEVMDIEVGDDCHSFVGNGMVNHNTSTAIAAMQKMIRDGLDNEGNGKFLYVSPTALVGNLPKAIHKFMSDPSTLVERVDRMSYTKFAREWRKDKHFADDYVAIIFDEAQELKNFNSSAKAKAAMSIRHPRKILLTASPMERDPREGYILAAVANNEDLNTKEGRARLRAYEKRFCEVVGGRVVGMKDDPVTAHDHRVWVKQNLFFADKRDVEEITLPQLRKDTVGLTMDPEVEERYREITDNISDVMEGLVAKYRDRSPHATDPAIEAAKVRLRKEFEALMRLSLLPDVEVPGAKNPKIEQSVRIMDERIGSGSRTLLFTDYPEMATHTVAQLSQRYPGLKHAVAYSDRIEIWQNGSSIERYRKRIYTDAEGKKWKPADWKVYVLKQVVSVDPQITSLVLTKSYALGQNLQAFDTVIHLDRDSWNSETMKQRTARAWRNGQKNPVSEHTLDMVYSDPRSERDATLDRIHAYMQQLESELFDAVVIESQAEVLGKEFFTMKRMDASFYQLNRSMMDMAISPYLARMGNEEGSEG